MSDLDWVTDPATIRRQTEKIWKAATVGETHFIVRPERLPDVAKFVLDVTRRNYPTGEIPVHGRFEHLRCGGIDRVAKLAPRLQKLDKLEQARALIDLTVVSVLLDAGAGDQWKYLEDGQAFTRSEGLAVASFHMFVNGDFSSDKNKPWQADSKRLKAFELKDLEKGFQISDENPLAGAEGRAGLLRRLGETLEKHPEYFGKGNPRPGNLVDFFVGKNKSTVSAVEILKALLIGFSDMWPARTTIDGVGFGDVWTWNSETIPFHKLSQWLTYSLFEPLQAAGLKVVDAEKLTGLPEYRNGGLFLDMGVLELRDSKLKDMAFEAKHPLIIEWRALTVQLLDEVGILVRNELGKTEKELPLANILQGGTWAAGREIAKKLRPETGCSPLKLISDGMVF